MSTFEQMSSALAIVNYLVYSLLSAFNLYYAYYILRLQSKQFHFMMFLMLQTCFVFMLVQIKLFATALQLYNEGGDFMYFWKLSQGLYTLFWFFDSLVHIIFAMKYWILSRKVMVVYSNQQHDPKFELKAKILYIFQIVNLVAASLTYFLYFGMNFSKSDNKPMLSEYIWIYCCSPPLIMLGLMIEAFWHLRNVKGDTTISRKQILIQVVANSLFALTQPLIYYFKPLSLWWTVASLILNSLNGLGLFILMLTLKHIASIQL